MTARVEVRTWLVALLAAAIALGPASATWAEERLGAGTKDVGLGGAISISHDNPPGGPGLLVFLSDTTTLTVAYRFQHISNGGA